VLASTRASVIEHALRAACDEDSECEERRQRLRATSEPVRRRGRVRRDV